MAFSLSRNERVYLQKQPSILAIPAGLGVANYCRHKKLALNPMVGMLYREDKTGTRTATQGITGRKHGTWSFEASLVTTGTAGQVPPADPLLVALFGQDGTVLSGSGSITGATNATPIVISQSAHGFANGDVVSITGVLGNQAANGTWVIANQTAGTYELVGSAGSGAYTSGGTASRVGVRYSVADAIPFFTMWAFRTPSTLQQRVGFGCVATEATFNLGQDIADWTASGESIWTLDSDTFASTDVTGKGGLAAFPSEPSGTLPADGGIIAGFTGGAILDGKKVASIRSATIRLATGNVLVKDTFGAYYPDTAEGDERNVSTSFSVYDTDGADLQALYAASLTKTPIDLIYQVGTVPGRVFVFQLKGVQLNQPALDDNQRRFVRSYTDSRATGSGAGALDEIRMTVI